MCIIRRTVENDIPALVEIVFKNYDKQIAEHFSAEILCAFSNYLFRPNFYTALIADNKVVGCASYISNWLSYGSFSLSWVNVGIEYQGNGYGKALVTKCLNDLNSIATLVLLATSVPEFYSKNWKFVTIDTFDGGDLTQDTLMSLKL